MSDFNKPKFRSQMWFDNPNNPKMTASYIERYLNYGITREELQSGKPIIGIAQTGSDLSCLLYGVYREFETYTTI